MKNSFTYVALSFFLLALCSIFSFSQEVDLTGTWVGTTVIPDQGEDEMTLVISKEEGQYKAIANDSMGMLVDLECEEFEFAAGSLTFTLSIPQEMETMSVWLTLEVEGDTMKGYWETAEGNQGDIELKKQQAFYLRT